MATPEVKDYGVLPGAGVAQKLEPWGVGANPTAGISLGYSITDSAGGFDPSNGCSTQSAPAKSVVLPNRKLKSN